MTGQISGTLFDKGTRHSIKPYPLDDLGRAWSSRVIKGVLESRFCRFTTANHRGYSATWTIEDDKLWLTGFQAIDSVEGKVGIQEVFGTDRLFAFWYSGELREPIGKATYGMYDGTVYESENRWVIDCGNLLHRYVRLNNSLEDRQRRERYKSFIDSL